MDEMDERRRRGLEMLRQARDSFGPDWFEELLKLKSTLPRTWLEMSEAQRLGYLRCRFDLTQAELARRAGLAQRDVSRLEAGSEALLSTWKKLYSGFGVDLLLIPMTDKTLDALQEPAALKRRVRLHRGLFEKHK